MTRQPNGRLDPDGNQKRRARKGEVRCGECEWFLPPVPGEPALCACNDFQRADRFCRSDDYAGTCKHFTRRPQ